MKNNLIYASIASIFVFALLVGSVSALTVPNLERYKSGSVQFLPSRDIEGESHFSSNSMVGYLTIKGEDDCGNPFQMQLNINNDNVYKSGDDIIVKGVAYGLWWTNKEFVSIDWVPGKYIIRSNGKVDVYLQGEPVVKYLAPLV
ncbi:MAG: hypothetical protein WC867_05590 [Candidatus Pacearchaeota archaeon]|jgi:hypothetical protein